MNTGFDDTRPISFRALVCDSQARELCLSKDACSCPIPQPSTHCFQPQRAAVDDMLRLWPAAGLTGGCPWNISPGWCAAPQEPWGSCFLWSLQWAPCREQFQEAGRKRGRLSCEWEQRRWIQSGKTKFSWLPKRVRADTAWGGCQVVIKLL